MECSQPWPLTALVLRTPRLELRPDDDQGLTELAKVALGGVHPPNEMPFAQPWTDVDPRYLARGVLQHHWGLRAALRPEDWTVPFLVRVDGRVIGCQSLSAVEFGTSREVTSGSWLGLPCQGHGYGTEMREAVLAFAFDSLGARTARSGAFEDNPASLAVSLRLGYRRDGTETWVRRGQLARQVRLLLHRADFEQRRRDWALAVSGLDGCVELLGGG